MLKKEFTKKDVTRMRNLISGNYSEKTRDVVGFKGNEETHQEGDVWVSDGRKWTIKNGIKQTVPKLGNNLGHKIPLFCPECKKPMNGTNDKKFYPIHKTCFNCVVDFESKLKMEGKWEDYLKEVKNKEIDHKAKEFNLMLDSALEDISNNYITEDGEIERWGGKINKDKVEEYRKIGLEYLDSLKS